MPDTRSHRGPGPEDERLFCVATHGVLLQATRDLGWLLTRGYAIRSANELVGNRYELAARQRLAVARCACSERSAKDRASRKASSEDLRGEELWIDGLNVLTAIEVALAGGVVLVGQDGCCRDVAGIHRQYRKVGETLHALRFIAELTKRWGVSKCRWWLDKPVSNSGRLKSVILNTAAELGCDWEAELVYSPDSVLSKTTHVVASADSVILDRCGRWTNFVWEIIAQFIPEARVINLSSRDLRDLIAPEADLSNSDCDETDQRELH